MNIFVYTSQANDASKRLINIIVKFTQRGKTEIFNSPDSLTTRLAQIRKDQTIVVLLIATQKELAAVLSFHEFLEGTKLILILPDREDKTISNGHKLYPRYVSYADSDFSDVGAVLKKMIANTRHNKRPIGTYQTRASETLFEHEESDINRV